MVHYATLSSKRRDVIAALITLGDTPMDSAKGADIKERVSEIRDEEASNYCYELLTDLTESGWLIRSEEQADGRVVEYRLTREAQEAVKEYSPYLHHPQLTDSQPSRRVAVSK